MKKIISLFQRNYDTDRLVRNEVVPGAEWVLAGEGIATRKYDGTCCLIRDGKLYKRYEVKAGKTPPPFFEAADEIDVETGKQQGWVPVGNGPEDQYHREAFEDLKAHVDETGLIDATYELVGPKVQGNPEKFEKHVLLDHSRNTELLDGGGVTAPRDFDGLRKFFEGYPDIEGIVWHHPDGRMVKIKAKDFGLRRKV